MLGGQKKSSTSARGMNCHCTVYSTTVRTSATELIVPCACPHGNAFIFEDDSARVHHMCFPTAESGLSCTANKIPRLVSDPVAYSSFLRRAREIHPSRVLKWTHKPHNAKKLSGPGQGKWWQKNGSSGWVAHRRDTSKRRISRVAWGITLSCSAKMASTTPVHL